MTWSLSVISGVISAHLLVSAMEAREQRLSSGTMGQNAACLQTFPYTFTSTKARAGIPQRLDCKQPPSGS